MSSADWGRFVLLSVKPRFANLILAGTKRVEFRRAWAAQDVSHIAIYSSAPVQRIVAIAAVEDVVRTTCWNLWKHSTARGGGLSRSELLDYFEGKEEGYALLLGEVTVLPEPLLPSDLISPFTPPQSFRYLTDREAERLWA